MIVKPSCGDPLTAINRAFLSMEEEEEEEEEEDGSVHMQQSISTMIYNMMKIWVSRCVGYGCKKRIQMLKSGSH